MRFKDRAAAGQMLARALKKYRTDTVIYALPRGGVVTAVQIAMQLHAPLDLIITRKIGHPTQPEYAIAATAENSHMVGSPEVLKSIDQAWLHEECHRQRAEAAQRRTKYLKGREEVSAEGKTAIIVDDGVATGLTMKAAIMEAAHRHPKKIIVAVPVVPKSSAQEFTKLADDVVAIITPSDHEYLGSVSAYYDTFPEVTDEEVIRLLKLV